MQLRSVTIVCAVVGSIAFAIVVVSQLTKHSHLAPSEGTQLPTMQCGQAAVRNFAIMNGQSCSSSDVESLLPRDDNGHTLLQIRNALTGLGVFNTVSRETFQQFVDGLFPCIIHLSDPDHFVVATGPSPTGIICFDERGMRYRIRRELLRRRWSGYLVRSSDRPTDAALQGDTPVACFKTFHIDVGDLAADNEDAVIVEFSFRNRGMSPLRVSKAYVDCSCISADVPDQPIAPGGESRVVVKYSKGRRPGAFSHAVILGCNDPNMKQIRLITTGASDESLECSPESIDFGSVSVGDTASRRVFVRQVSDDGPIPEIISVTTSMAGAFVSRQERRDKGPPTSPTTVTTIELKFSPDSSQASKEVVGYVAIETDDRVTSIPMRADVVGPVTLVPNAFDFGQMSGKGSDDVTATIKIQSNMRVPYSPKNIRVDTGIERTVACRYDDHVRTVSISCDTETAIMLHKKEVTLLLTSGETTLEIPVVVFAWQ